MSNTDLYNLVDDQSFNPSDFNERYADGLVDIDTGAKTEETIQGSN